ncbi:MAG: SDR family oxidoreductase [Pseudomonadota bacterium]|jgi:NAD(P)-dependent dehydrogenase (short-subunit alcohol dehydrogenase family)|nr:SDR family oxidoreductase [Pseudomonadota bacterium]
MTTPIDTRQLFDLSGQLAIVTGAAEGIGNGIARHLAAAGALVVIADINREGAEAAAEAIVAGGGRARAYDLDQSREESVVALVAAVRRDLGPIHILVNNAGLVDEAPLVDTTAAQWDRLHQVNLRGAFLCLREVARVMVADGVAGRIINVSSIGSLHPVSPGIAAYSATKGGINSLTRNAAQELVGSGITVNAVLPGGVITDGQLRRQRKPIDPAQLARLAPPTGRHLTPEDIGLGVLFFASPAAGQITAQLLAVDGGTLNA